MFVSRVDAQKRNIKSPSICRKGIESSDLMKLGSLLFFGELLFSTFRHGVFVTLYPGDDLMVNK